MADSENLDPDVAPAGSTAASGQYTAAGLDISDVVRRAHEASGRNLAAVRAEERAVRAAAAADRADAERARAQAHAELRRAREFREALQAERIRLRDETDAIRAELAARNADRDRGIEILLRAALDLVQMGDRVEEAPQPNEVVIDLRETAPPESLPREVVPRHSALSHPSAGLHGHESIDLSGELSPAPNPPDIDDELARAVRVAISRVVGVPADRDSSHDD